jgi:hypothetical protein
MMKQFKLAAGDIEPLVRGYGGCISSDMITVEGYPVRFMYRERPSNDIDSGWRFLSGFENDQYMSNPDNHAVYDVNTIANYDPSIIPLLDSPIGSVLEKSSGSERFVPVSDCKIPADE